MPRAAYLAMYAMKYGARTLPYAREGNAAHHARHVPRAYLAIKTLIASAGYAKAGFARFLHAPMARRMETKAVWTAVLQAAPHARTAKDANFTRIALATYALRANARLHHAPMACKTIWRAVSTAEEAAIHARLKLAIHTLKQFRVMSAANA